MLDLVINKVR